MQTAEIRMMENVGDSGLRFKIWFCRWKSQDTYILQASSAEAKTTWTDVIRKILWRQALRNRGGGTSGCWAWGRFRLGFGVSGGRV